MKIKTDINFNKDNETSKPKIPVELDESLDYTAINLSDKDRMAAVRAAQLASEQRTVVSKPKEPPKEPVNKLSDEPVFARESTDLGPEWIRIDLPSRGVPYGTTSDMFIRPLMLLEISRLSAAAKRNSLTHILDVLNNAISVDIRDLTYPDFRVVLYNLYFNTYPSRSLPIHWTSRYGNQAKYSTNKRNLEVVFLKMTPEEYRVWKADGLAFPTMRDIEIMETNTIEDDQVWIAELAQYVSAEAAGAKQETYLQDKIDYLNTKSPEFFLRIQEFEKRIEHGPIERVELVDEAFDPVAAIEFFLNTAKELDTTLRSALSHDITGQEMAAIALANQIEKLHSEAKEIKDQLDAGINPEPKKEVITLNIDVMSFFPTI